MLNDSKRKAQLIIVATFLLGMFTGGLTIYILQKQQAQNATTVSSITTEIDKRVTLQPEQRAKVENILWDTKKEYQKVKEQTQPLYDTAREAARAKIRVLLTADQQANFDKYVQELDAKRQAKRQTEANAK